MSREKRKKDLRDKKRKLKQDEDKVKFKMEITARESGAIEVYGPINDPLLVMQLLAGTLNTVVDHNFAEADKRIEEEKAPAILGADGQEITDKPNIEIVQ